VSIEALRSMRRFAGAVVTLSAIALGVARAKGGATPSAGVVSFVAAVCFSLSFVALLVLWQREHRTTVAAATARERQQLALLKLQLDSAKHKGKNGADAALQLRERQR
jgi:formate/nitrite transporter FocA (FNT family)